MENLFECSRHEPAQANLKWLYANMSRRDRRGTKAPNDKSVEIIEKDEIIDKHILGPQDNIMYIPKQYPNDLEASTIIAQLNNKYVSIVTGKVDGTTYEQFLQSWSCWADDKMLGDNYWSIKEVMEAPGQIATCFNQKVSMNQTVY
jgi:hypothetical protein